MLEALWEVLVGSGIDYVERSAAEQESVWCCPCVMSEEDTPDV